MTHTAVPGCPLRHFNPSIKEGCANPVLSPLVLHRGGTPAPPPCTTPLEEEATKGFPDPDPQQLWHRPTSGDS